jgi:hypothetical protein
MLGICPFSFNQLVSASHLTPAGDCGEVFFQHSYQRTDYTSREDIARAIKQAEMMIREQVNYNLIPDWVVDERKRTVRPARPEVYNQGSLNVRGQMKSIESRWGHVVSGGIRAQSLISAGVAVVITDIDGDGYSETCTVTVATTVTDVNEIRVYYPGQLGDWRFEVRPIEVSISAGIATIRFKRWQIVQYPDQERLDAAEAGNVIDADAAATYYTTVDVYREYNDPQTQASFLWENDPSTCSSGIAASFTTQSGALFVRDERLGIVGYIPGNWDAVAQSFTPVCWTFCTEPDQIRLYYYSGWRSSDPRHARPYIDMDPYWERAVCYLSIYLMDRFTCDCANVERFVRYWREDLARQGAEVTHQVSMRDLDNPFGTGRGAVYAWHRVLEGDRRVN